MDEFLIESDELVSTDFAVILSQLSKNTLWVRITYSDNSVFVFKGTTDLETARAYGYTGELDDMSIYDIGHNRAFHLESSYKVEVSQGHPGFERRIDQFANQFI